EGAVNPRRVPAALLLVMFCAPAAARADTGEQLVFGSFRSEDNAARWAAELGDAFRRPIHVEPVQRADGVWYRVRTGPVTPEERAAVETAAAARQVEVWVIRGSYVHPATVTSSSSAARAAGAKV